jgi:hypothetical protein
MPEIDSRPYEQAKEMIRLFQSVGARHFSVTWTDGAGEPIRKTGKDGKEGVRFWRAASPPVLCRHISEILGEATQNQHNIVVRPGGSTEVTFVQLDDLDAEKLGRVAAAVFLVLETSPGNVQAWLAIKAVPDKDFMRRLKRGVGADKTASGATKIAGSLNFKDKYAPNFPRVVIHSMYPGRVTTPSALEQLGLVAAPEPEPQRPSPTVRLGNSRAYKWPSWERCLERAPPSQSGKGNRLSIADFTWCLIAADWGWPVDQIAERLMMESSKARENGLAYAQQTAERAAEAAEKNQARRNPSKRPQI